VISGHIHKNIIRRWTIILLFGILSGELFSTCAAIAVDHGIDSAMMHLVRQRYDSANEAVGEVLANNPQNIDALYMMLTIEQTRLLDYESYVVDGGRFMELADSICSVLKNKLPKIPAADSARYLFYLGNIYGGKSLILAKSGNWFQAAREALTSVAILRQVNELDSTFYAAYLGIGVFNYYLSQNLGWIPFMGDKSEEGLREIELATRSRFPFNYAANNSLAWILIDRREMGRADSIVNFVLKGFPDNTIFLRIKARIALWTGQFSQAINVGLRLSKLSLLRNPINWSDCLSGYQVVVESYTLLGDTLRAKKEAAHALTFEVPPSAREIPYVRKHIVYLRTIAAKSVK
jgi:tetratricopeptide (TPR) repeat protein